MYQIAIAIASEGMPIFSNKPVGNVIEAYEKACKKTGLQLHFNGDGETIIKNGEFTKKAKEVLLKYGLESNKFLDGSNKISEANLGAFYCWFTCLGDEDLMLLPCTVNEDYVNYDVSTGKTYEFVEREKPAVRRPYKVMEDMLNIRPIMMDLAR